MDTSIDFSNQMELKHIIDDIDLTEEAPAEEPARQYYFIAKAASYVKKMEAEVGHKLTFFVKTFGCQMNARDSEKLTGILTTIGYLPAETEEADFVIYNTCTVRENANNKVYGKLGYLHGYKKKNPHMMIAMCGCMMQEEKVVKKIQQSYRFVDLIFGTHNLFQFAELYVKAVESNKMTVEIWEGTDKIVENLPNQRKYSFKSGVNIMFGCNNFCSYCIVPYVRGRERSREPQEIIHEIEALVKDGVIEIMLLGQNVNSYGKDLDIDVDFADLICMVNDIDGVERIRFMTSHPKDLSDKLIDAIAECDKVCKQLHLPVQAGSNKILKEMNRKYTKEDYLAKIEKVKKRIPNISLSTDIIVGFPTETKEDFEETLDVLRKVEYDNIFSFIYSRREGTPAAKLDFVLTDEEIHENFNKLLEVQNEISKRKNEAYVGRVEKVLVDGVSKNDETTLSGRCDSSKIVNFKGDKSLIGKYIDVRITEAHTWSLNGEIAE